MRKASHVFHWMSFFSLNNITGCYSTYILTYFPIFWSIEQYETYTCSCPFPVPHALRGCLSPLKAAIATAAPGYLQLEGSFFKGKSCILSRLRCGSVWTAGHHSVFSGIFILPPQECDGFLSCNMLDLHLASTVGLKQPCYLLLNPQLCTDEKRIAWNIVTVIITYTVCNI